jgi:phosphoribosylformylglycinamidine synthase
MVEACKLFETPVTGGNVSFYNETDGAAIYPTPTIGMVGVVEDVDHVTGHAFRNSGDAIVLLGENTVELGGSEYLYVTADLVAGEPPAVDLMTERTLQQAVLEMIQQGVVRSAHDCSDGGLACTLAESALGSEDQALGFEVEIDDELPPVAVLFGEAQGRVVLSCAPEDLEALLRLAERYGVPARKIGEVRGAGDPLSIRLPDATVTVDASQAAEAYFGTIPGIMDAPATSEA